MLFFEICMKTWMNLVGKTDKTKTIDILLLELGESINTVSYDMKSNLRPISLFNLLFFNFQKTKVQLFFYRLLPFHVFFILLLRSRYIFSAQEILLLNKFTNMTHTSEVIQYNLAV